MPFLCLFFDVTLPFSIGFWAKAAQNRSKPVSLYHKSFMGIGVWIYQLRMGEDGIDDEGGDVRRMRYGEEMMYWFGV